MVRESTFTGHEQEFNAFTLRGEPTLKADLIWEKVLMWTHFSSESRPKRFSVRQIANQQLCVAP
ncbi:hypothetical protein L914_17544 [Phytophthora nicotianae]|uniref:Uncharacterized protein n=1 Tax=Phytophthora nicotianae TaxID=4792 RepID=W2MGW2_PHYNI|nr:hypothetical protein L914_17544 [Phytophthora nicotianae]